MLLEDTTLVNLEILQTMMTGKRRGSLLGLMDKTATAMGARTLRQWLQALSFQLQTFAPDRMWWRPW